jgi:hypothetical protein
MGLSPDSLVPYPEVRDRECVPVLRGLVLFSVEIALQDPSPIHMAKALSNLLGVMGSVWIGFSPAMSPDSFVPGRSTGTIAPGQRYGEIP